jgi:hypothetical protein
MSYCKYDGLGRPETPVEVRGNTFVMTPRFFAEKRPRRAQRRTAKGTAQILRFFPRSESVIQSH